MPRPKLARRVISYGKSLPARVVVIVLCLSVLAVAALIGSYPTESASTVRPTSSLALSDTLTIKATSRANPAFHLNDGREILTAYNGPQELRTALEQNRAKPLSLASADFDEDGVPDLVSGYSYDGRGIITVMRGNFDSRDPNAQKEQSRRTTGTVTGASFLSPALSFPVSTSPDFLGAGDFDADGHQDLVAATRGNNKLSFLLGDGRGHLGNPIEIAVGGSITAFVSGEINRADGLADLVIGVNNQSDAEVMVLESPAGAMRAKPEVFPLGVEATAFALGQFDERAETDLAVAAGTELVIISGRDRKLSLNVAAQSKVAAATIDRHSMPYFITALAAGNFIWDKSSQTDLALLASDHSVHFLLRANQARTALRKHDETHERPEEWRNQRVVSSSTTLSLSPNTIASHPVLLSARVSGRQSDDLMLFETGQQEIHLINADPAPRDETGRLLHPENSTEPITSAVEGESPPVAVLPMRLNSTAFSSLVVLRSGQTAPAVMLNNPSAIITVNSSADTNERDNVLTLREAILLANEELLKSSLTAAEQQQVQGTPAPGLDEVRFAIAAGNTPTETVRNEQWQAKLAGLFSNPSTLQIAPLVSSLSIGPLALTPSFTGQTAYSLPSTNNSHPHSVVAFERAGRPGLAVTNRPQTPGQSGDSVTVFYAHSNNGIYDGTLVNGVTYPLVAGAQPQRVVVGNLGQTNVPSLVVAASFANKVAVLLGKGADDTFQPAVYYQTDPNPNVQTFPESLTLGDFNGDANLDIAVANYDSSTIGILLGNSDGTFQNVVSYPEIPTSAPEFIVTADFNGDGKLDLATCNSGDVVGNNKINVLFGNGNGTFQSPQLYTTGTNPLYMVTADFNGDGKPDLATSNSHGSISVLLNSGTGTFPSKTDPSAGADPNLLAAADVNLDGFPDLVVASSGGNNVMVLLNNTDGTFQQPAISTTAVPGSNPLGVTTGDFNVDGKPDIAVANNGNNTLGVLLNTTVDVCGFSLNPTSQNFDSPAGSANVAVTANAGCSWSATSNASWIHSTASGNGNGTALYTVDQNIGAARSGTLAIGGHLLTVNQASGCSFSINPTVKNAVSGPDNGFVTVTSSGGDCPWTATSNVAWIQIAGATQGVLTGVGNGVVNYNVAPNSGPSRTGTLTIAGQIFTVLQNPGGVCSYTISPISQGFGPGSGTGQFSITAPFGCNWTATSNNTSFVTITLGASGSGNGTVNYSVAANVSGSPRSGTITVTGGNTFTIIQGTSNTNLRSITLTAPLPQITDPITIDGWTQGGVGYSGPPLIEINGQNLAAQSGLPSRDGLRITAGSSLIRGLALNRFTSATRDAAIRLTTNGNNVIEGCYLGSDANGTNAFVPANTNGLASGITIQSSSDNLIGGLTPAKRNLISGIDGTGISVSNGATRNLVQGNYIGVDVTGSVRLTDASGNAYQRIGVYIQNAGGNTVGGTMAGAGNLISGNLDYGVFVQDESTNNLVQGNFIGTNALGVAAVPNNNAGVFIYRPTGTATSADNTIGGTTPAARNVISGNEPYGVVVGNRATGSLVQGNYIGTNASGTAAVANTYGVTVTQATGSSVGGDPLLASGARNVISGNRLTGIYLGFLNNGVAGGTGVNVLGNYIGTDVTGDNRLGNSRDGVFVEVQSASDTIQSNRVAYNGDNGIRIPNVSDVPGTPGVKIQITENLIYANSSLGIDLGEAGVTPNDPLDADAGANLLQNFPVLTSAAFSASSGETVWERAGEVGRQISDPLPAAALTINGTLNSTPNAMFTVNWYFSADAQCVANQEASRPLVYDKVSVMTDSNGDAQFSFPFDFPPGITSGIINCTAKDAQGNTSEFSACMPVTAPAAATTTITSVTGSGTYGSSATLTGTLTSNSTPVSGKTLNFTVDGSSVCGGSGQVACPATNASGIATLSVSGYSAGGHPVIASFAGDSSYAGSNGNGTLTVSKASLTITADNQVKLAGNPNPPLTFTPTGFVNGDTASVLSGTPSLTTTATQSSPGGSYPITITQNTLTAANYVFSFVNGTLNITPLVFVETGTNNLAALESVSLTRGPFVLNNTQNYSTDQRTRIIFFTTDLGFAQSTQPNSSVLSVQLNGNSYAVEGVGPNSTIGGSYIVFRLPDLSPGTYPLAIRINGANSANSPNLQIISSPSSPAAAPKSNKTKLAQSLLVSLIDLIL
jgi:MBG domain-containing protein/VCBS repeat protein/Big-like domain-containing protein/BACON domain-containing protein/all-beta uncharacterized protein